MADITDQLGAVITDQAGAAITDGIAAGGSATATPDPSAHGHTSSTPTLAARATLTIQGATSAHASSAPTLAARATITAQSSTSAHTSSSPSLAARATITAQSQSSAHTSSLPSLTARATIATASASHTQTSSSPSLTAKATIATDPAAHAHASSSPVPTASSGASNAVIIAQSVSHDHASSSPALSALAVLAPFASVHLHTSSSPAPLFNGGIAPIPLPAFTAEMTIDAAPDEASLVDDAIIGDVTPTVVLEPPTMPKQYATFMVDKPGMITITITSSGEGQEPDVVINKPIVAQSMVHTHLSSSPTLATYSGAGDAAPTTIDAALPVLALTFASGTTQSSYPPSFDTFGLAEAQVGDTIWINRRDKAGALVEQHSKTITLAEANAEAASFGFSDIASGTFRYTPFLSRGAVRSNDGPTLIHGPDDVAPVLTAPTGVKTSHQAATISVTTSDGDGTLYYLVNTSATATLAAVKAGSSQAVVASGAQSANITGLSASTGYYAHFVHTDAAGNDSTVANSSIFTTDAAPSTQWDASYAAANVILTNGNLTAAGQNFGGDQNVRSTKGVAEATHTGSVTYTINNLVGGGSEVYVGLAYAALDNNELAKTSPDTVGIIFGTWGYELRRAGVAIATDYVNGFAINDTVGFTLTGGSIQMKKNGANLGAAMDVPTGTGSVYPIFGTTDASRVTANFGAW